MKETKCGLFRSRSDWVEELGRTPKIWTLLSVRTVSNGIWRTAECSLLQLLRLQNEECAQKVGRVEMWLTFFDATLSEVWMFPAEISASGRICEDRLALQSKVFEDPNGS